MRRARFWSPDAAGHSVDGGQAGASVIRDRFLWVQSHDDLQVDQGGIEIGCGIEDAVLQGSPPDACVA